MEITWYGHSCFRLTERGKASVVCDPFNHEIVGYESLKLKADIVTISHDSPSHNYMDGVKGTPYIITGPGEYEIGGVFITGLRTDMHKKKNIDQVVNTLYLIDYFGINIVHLGDMQQIPTQTDVESIGPVNVVMVPVGGHGGLTASKASEAISLFEPEIVIPMHYATSDSAAELDPIGKFLKEMGLSTIETAPNLKLSDAKDLPEETEVVVLDYPRS